VEKKTMNEFTNVMTNNSRYHFWLRAMSIFSFVFILPTIAIAENQRLAIAPVREIVLTPKNAAGSTSQWIESYCLDEDLPAPVTVTEFPYLHTPGSIEIFTGDLSKPLKSENFYGLKESALRIEADGVKVRFSNQTGSVLTIKITRATVFGRVAGLESNQDLLKIVEASGKPNSRFSEWIEGDYNIVKQKIWRANANLSMLRVLGYWDSGIERDQVDDRSKMKAMNSAVQMLKIPWTASLEAELDKEFRRTKGYSYIQARESKLSDARSLSERSSFVLAVEASEKCAISAYGVSLRRIRLTGSAEVIRAFPKLPNGGTLPIETNCQNVTFERSKSGGGIVIWPPVEPIIEFDPVEPSGTSKLMEALAKNQCLAEICLNSKGDRKIGLECNGFGVGVSTSSEVEVKIAGVTIPVKK
jgi:hypothetical protein